MSADRGSKATRHLQYPAADLSRPQRIQIAGSELCFRAPPPTSPPPRAPPRHALGSRKAPNGVGKQAGGRWRREEPTSADQKSNAGYERFGCHKPLIPVMCRPSQTPHRQCLPLIGRLGRGEAFEPKGGAMPHPTNGISPPKGPLQSVPSPGIADDPPRQGAARAVHRQPTGSTGTPRPALEPILFPVTDPFCRLPLPTLFHRPEAVHLGDLARYEYDQARAHSVLRIFKGPPGAPTPRRRGGALPSRWTLPPAEPLPGVGRLLNRKDNSSRGPRRRLRLPLTLPPTATPRSGILTRFLFEICTDGRPPQCSRPRFFHGQPPSLLLIEVRLLPRRPVCSHSTLLEDLGRSTVQPARGSRQSASFCAFTGLVASLTRTHVVDSLVRVSRRVEWGARWPTPRAPGCHEGTPAEVATTLLGSQTTIRWRDHPPGLGRLADSLPPLTEFTASIWAAFPNNPTSPTTPAGDRVRAQRVVTLSLGAPFHGTCAVPSQGRFADYTIQRAKSRRFSYRALPPFAAATRGILLVFPPDLGSHPSKASVTEATAGGGPFEPGPRHPLRATQGQGGRSHHCRAGRPWGKVFFSQPRQGGGRPSARRRLTTADRLGGGQGTGGENTPGGRPGRCTLDLVASGATYAQRLDGSRDSAIHTKYRDFATLFIDARAKISAVESRLGYRVRGRTAATASSSFGLAQIARKWLFGVAAPTVRWVADAEPAGRRVANAGGEGFDGRCDSPPLRRRWASWCSSLAWSRRFAESTNDPSAGSVDFSQTLSGGEPPTPPLIQHFTDHSIDYPARRQGYRLAEYISCSAARPVTSKGITAPVIASNFRGLNAIVPLRSWPGGSPPHS
ncbi:hypothetical protein H6P81_021709 [Aristolochia fimbriata]|uniref:Uncharacterized protein n=1 Tax=Aristolochia fimbriata TaxID=158543 RepID=A0AAV7DP76_ARIFI|nr:hypothetical protein H6P81_021709 [Aristolochia fimbriata]